MKSLYWRLSLLGLLLHPLTCPAGNIYKFRDADGNILFTNIVSPHNTPMGDDFHRYTHLERVTWYKDTNVHSYGNWGSSEASVLPSFSRFRNAYDGFIDSAAAAYGVDRGLVKAVIHTESGFNTHAISRPGAQGLMQLMPATAARYACNDAFDPQQNILAGTKHLSYLISRYKSLELALAAYNAGEKNVDKYGGIPPFAETQDYVQRVMSRYHKLYSGPALAVNDTPAIR